MKENRSAERSRDLYTKILATYVDVYARQDVKLFLSVDEIQRFNGQPSVEVEEFLAARVGQFARRAAIAAMREMNRPLLHIEKSMIKHVLNLSEALCERRDFIPGLEDTVGRELIEKHAPNAEICADCLAVHAEAEKEKP